MNSSTDYIQIVLSLIPLILRGVINFAKEEKAITNNRKFLLDQIRVALSLEFSKNLQFERSTIQINDDFRSKLREYMNDFLYTNTSTLNDFNEANKKSKKAVNWIRFFKYSLVISTFLSFAVYIMSKNVMEFKSVYWYYNFLFFVFSLVIIWFGKERSVDTFHNMCVRYEIERHE
jgi:hypothetical protein